MVKTSDTMALVELGRVCIKRFGRDAGSKAVITKVIDKNFVNIVTATRPRDRRCNVQHLEFLSEKIDPSNKEQLYKTLEIAAPQPKAPREAAKQQAPKKK